MAELTTEYATLLTDKKRAYSEYNSLRKEMQEILNAKDNVEQLLEIDLKEEQQQKEKDDKSL